ncbi:transcription factor Adf-1-like [Leptopilina heterotoma]|uniref:transcription factor Adf-1-like n=1 Tax=Leptopilina heterotoma TaxID=63436 RepID=UPI001CA822CD|nr:transcription factor Adf-1-like [Leptopilina heterotoma]
MEDLNSLLIRLVQNHPIIYDKASKHYKNNFKKKEAWEQIVLAFNTKVRSDITADQAFKRWKKLKDIFVKERTKIKAYIPSGSSAQCHTEKWMYYDELIFLKDIVDHKSTVSSFQRPNEHLEEGEDEEHEEEGEVQIQEEEGREVFDDAGEF